LAGSAQSCRADIDEDRYTSNTTESAKKGRLLGCRKSNEFGLQQLQHLMDLRQQRQALGLSQSKLARLSHVSGFKICTYELGDCSLTAEQQHRIREALCAEAERLRKLSIQIDFGSSRAQEATTV
jgi:DNA-binding transcriptional regulator YiaG